MDTLIPRQLGYISREVCDGQTLASPGRWPIAARRYPDSSLWRSISASFMEHSRRFGTPDLLMRLALGRVDSGPFGPVSINSLKSSTLDILSEHGLKLVRTPDDRTDMPIGSFSSMRLRTWRWELVISLLGSESVRERVFRASRLYTLARRSGTF